MGEGSSRGEQIDAVSYEDASHVQPAERDRELDVNASTWPPPPPPIWRPTRYGLTRRIAAEEGDRSPVPAELEELILRFPSAPIHGLQRLHGHHMKLSPSENFHTFRILRSADPDVTDKPIKRIFLMHTGLNERDTMGLYYRLSSQLIAQEEGTVCIVRPFPGHMTRYPHGAYAETPLDLYLWDGSHLFRQFMRFMVETQWFLSTIVRRSTYRCASGANLLGEDEEIDKSRLDPVILAREIRASWRRLHKASIKTAKAEAVSNEGGSAVSGNGPGHPGREPVNQEQAYQRQIVAAIKGLRNTLKLDEHFDKQGGDLRDPDETSAEDEEDEPSLHVIGYSLGGFTAQSVFMSWPFAIASCSTMLAGGALRELAPTGFADPEEWQTVLHSLRYELDDRMMSTHIDVEKDYVAGIDRELFTYLKRTFYEVFQQEYRGSIQTRYEAFGDRMFFIVGGDDPVMRPESVLQSGPKGGLNLLEVGGLGHFLQDGSSGASGETQKTFWLPEMATLIHRFSDNAAAEHKAQRRITWLDKRHLKPMLTRAEWQAAITPKNDKGKGKNEQGKGEGNKKGQGKNWKEADKGAMVRPLSTAELIAIEHEGGLSGELFERCLDDLLHRVSQEKDGTLFVLRNEVPTVFMPPQAIRETAAALYHDDLSIVRYCHGISARREVLEKNIDKICLVLPWNAASLMKRMDAQRGFPSQAESAGGGVKDRMSPDKLCEKSLKQCLTLAERKNGGDSIRVFNGNDSLDTIKECFQQETDHRLEGLIEESREFTRVSDDEEDVVPSLPDCWIWVSSESLATKVAKKTMKLSIDGLLDFASGTCKDEQAMLRHIREGQVRVVNVSRARYNPRFRGRLVVDGKAARKRVVHAALCVGLSDPVVGKNWQSVFS